MRRLLKECRDEPLISQTYIGSSNQTSRAPWSKLVENVGHDLEIRRSYDWLPGSFTFDDDFGKRASAATTKLGTDSKDGAGWQRVLNGDFDAAFKARWGAVPLSHVLFDGAHHEATGPNGPDGPPDLYRSMQHYLIDLLAPINEERDARDGIPIKWGVTLMGQDARDSRFGVAWCDQWTVPELDYVAWDTYASDYPPTSFAAIHVKQEDYCELRGFEMAVGEYGCFKVPDNMRAVRGEWIEQAEIHMMDNDYLYGCYWNSEDNWLEEPVEFEGLGSYVHYADN